MLDEILDHLVGEKMDYKEYKTLAEESNSEEYRGMFNKMADDEHNHYKMLKEYVEQMMNK